MGFERKKNIQFWQWDMFMVLRNPDAQKKQKMWRHNRCLDVLLNIFKMEDHEDEMVRKATRKAEEEVLASVLEEIGDDGWVPLYKGGRFEKREAPKLDLEEIKTAEGLRDAQTTWFDVGGPPRDFTGLLINVLMYKLAVILSLDARLVVSGKELYIMIRADIKDLKRVAEDAKFNCQFAVGITDLSSLEPCDKKLRPLRKLETD